ncbi:hypothetical protein B296_00011491 [Ensete ventricosum]|uniref:Uncharacterized protein n=1 Tax=Ensete ventricosum TaxID=4639 RepID=A0A427AFG4_ENSVE|nr:hypothetical protein B296_00011491 [Ensete ventricosum]
MVERGRNLTRTDRIRSGQRINSVPDVRHGETTRAGLSAEVHGSKFVLVIFRSTNLDGFNLIIMFGQGTEEEAGTRKYTWAVADVRRDTHSVAPQVASNLVSSAGPTSVAQSVNWWAGRWGPDRRGEQAVVGSPPRSNFPSMYINHCRPPACISRVQFNT